VVSTDSDSYTDLYDTGRWFSLIPVLGGLGLLGRVILVFFQDRLARSHQVLIFGESRFKAGKVARQIPTR
jgi:hypothetical protein